MPVPLMKRFELQFEKSFFIRHGIVVGMAMFFASIPLMLTKSGGILFWLLPLLVMIPLAIPLREWLTSVRIVDNEGVTRHDGRQFLWADLISLQEVNCVNRHGQTGALNHLDIFFTSGRARILPMELRNGYAAIHAIQEFHAKPAESIPLPLQTTPSSPEPEPQPAQPARCSLCGDLGPFHLGIQKHGHEHLDTFLPAAFKNLQFVKDIRPGATRTPELLRCPECSAWFLYEIGYEYLATGSEDEQRLSRLTTEEAEEIMRR